MYSVRRAFTPLQVEQCELSEETGPIAARRGPDGRPYAAARVLVRLHTEPLGTVEVPLPADAAALTGTIEERLGAALRRHEEADAAAGGPPAGPACLAARRALLADAPLATVVIPTRDRPELLERCLDAVLAVEYPGDRFEVIVADNVPSDGRTRELVERRQAGAERLRYLRTDRPGSGAARNDGVALARGRIVAFVDDDAVVDRHWLAELALGFRTEPAAACVTGLVLPLELDTLAQALFEEYGGFGAGFEGAVFDTGVHRPPDPLFPFNPGIVGSGNNIAFDRQALVELGGYDERLGNGTPVRSGEDWELLLRLLRAGRTAVYRPSALVHHRDRRGYDELRAQLRDYGVGMSGAVARTVVHDPRAALELARRLPRAARYLLGAQSPKNEHRTARFPADLRRAELAGLALGPLASLRSRRARGESGAR